MAIGFGESSSREPEGPSCCSAGSSSNDAGSFECNICFELAQDPIVTLCGHLFCWPCLYKWLQLRAHSPECPVCKAFIEEHKLVPLYGRGKTPTDPRSKSVPGPDIPNRPAGQRPPTAPQPGPNQFGAHSNPWFMGGTPVGTSRFGNFTFSAAISGFIPFLSVQMHGFPDVGAYGSATRYRGGYQNSFDGGSMRGHGLQQGEQHGLEGHQADRSLKIFFLFLGAVVIASLIWL